MIRETLGAIGIATLAELACIVIFLSAIAGAYALMVGA